MINVKYTAASAGLAVLGGVALLAAGCSGGKGRTHASRPIAVLRQPKAKAAKGSSLSSGFRTQTTLGRWASSLPKMNQSGLKKLGSSRVIGSVL